MLKTSAEVGNLRRGFGKLRKGCSPYITPPLGADALGSLTVTKCVRVLLVELLHHVVSVQAIPGDPLIV